MKVLAKSAESSKFLGYHWFAPNQVNTLCVHIVSDETCHILTEESASDLKKLAVRSSRGGQEECWCSNRMPMDVGQLVKDVFASVHIVRAKGTPHLCIDGIPHCAHMHAVTLCKAPMYSVAIAMSLDNMRQHSQHTSGAEIDLHLEASDQVLKPSPGDQQIMCRMQSEDHSFTGRWGVHRTTWFISSIVKKCTGPQHINGHDSRISFSPNQKRVSCSSQGSNAQGILLALQLNAFRQFLTLSICRDGWLRSPGAPAQPRSEV